MQALTVGNQIFEMAMRMEEVAHDFYEALGLGSDNPAVRDFCTSAAKEEARHRVLFEGMLKNWASSHQPRLTAPETIEAMLSIAKSTTRPDPAVVQKVAIGGVLRDALKMALEMENGSIRFYERLLGALPDLGDPLRQILQEERTHVSRITALAEALRR